MGPEPNIPLLSVVSKAGPEVCGGLASDPLSEEIRASPLPVVTFRAGNYTTQCLSTFRI